REHLIQGMKKFASFKFTDEEWNQFAPNLCYISGKYTELEHFKKLSEQLKKFENEEDANRLYYMALPPSVFPTIIDNLDKSDLLQENGAWRRVVLEKPFGTNLET